MHDEIETHELATPEEAYAKGVDWLKPDVVLLGVSFLKQRGSRLVAELAGRFPDVRILIVTDKSDEATAYFRDQTDDPATPEVESGSEVYQVEAQGHVRVDRNEQTAFSDHLAYNPDSEVAVLTGNVTINSKKNTYRGARAELDLQNDISRLLPAPGQRVFTTIRPKDKNQDSSGAQPAPVN